MKVSVIIPSYNTEQYIVSCVESVLSQTYKNIEIICIDDCSTDGTYEILQSYAQKYSKIILQSNKENKGAAFSRNRGLHIAQGEYIQFLDSDDSLLPEKIEHQATLVSSANSKPDFIAGNYISNLNGKTTHPEPFTENVWMDLIKGSLGSTCSNLWKKSTLDSINGWTESAKSSQETDIMFRLLKNKAVVIYDRSPLTLVNCRTIGSISTNDRAGNPTRFIDIRLSIAQYLKANKMFTKAIEREHFKILFHTLHLLYKFDPAKAQELYKVHLPEKFPLTAASKTSFFYRLLFFLFGFNSAEKIIGKVKS
ncbi:MAG: glycosyltransferase family 2 protein [Bacteroidetes bacterium]|nr:MAG: glycosyltransferase family 2 protein [Bacteroidota bacterium]